MKREATGYDKDKANKAQNMGMKTVLVVTAIAMMVMVN